MQIVYSCPVCGGGLRTAVVAATDGLRCASCGWQRELSAARATDAAPQHCLVCGCDDLWRQKDFPQKLGLALVGAGALLSTIAVALHMPSTALAVLLAFALADLLLFAWMPDVLVCYRCSARHRRTTPGDHGRFNLETAERYRQEAARLNETRVWKNSAHV
ncbi:MAG: hypothetical protein ACT4QC_19815 [Planctomycetaceae bacterium]